MRCGLFFVVMYEESDPIPSITGRLSALPSYPFINQWLYSSFFFFLAPDRSFFYFNFLILYTVGRTIWTVDQSVERPIPTHRIV
jgi:hypothetical protein